MNVTAKILFEPRDMWVGVFWDTETELMEDHKEHYRSLYEYRTRRERTITIYICIIPMFPLKLTFEKDLYEGWDD